MKYSELQGWNRVFNNAYTTALQYDMLLGLHNLLYLASANS